ncbi:putative alkyl hydroperoxide reductase/ Thiol specific antioxidant/ Mal allergen [Candidatus Terasakiella magnetica]|nr:putative alkyl hydroperoxide reductase/ Thiol specific antioxidant/ Mal allergen [Candidatus Terasakiella magnetica]
MFGITRAPDFDHAGLTWFNVDAPLVLDDLRGKLVILDFWTFCCVNCLHTLPVLERLEQAYPDDVRVIGVHSPKFAHERAPEAVASAIERYGIRHPVVHDPHTILWEEYCIRAWPSLVFISPDGMVVGQMSGEPHPDLLLQGVGTMLNHFAHHGALPPSPTAPDFVSVPRPHPHPEGRLRFPGKIKPCPSPDGRRLWAIADSGHNQVVLADEAGHELARWGSGPPGLVDGSEEARFDGPEGLSCDLAYIYVADTRNHAIRRINRATGEIDTLVGMGIRGPVLDGESPASETALASPWDVEVRGSTLFIANAGSHQILALDLVDGRITPLAGTGGENIIDGPAGSALLAQPSGLALSADESCLYFVDSETSSLRRLGLGAVSTVNTLIGQGLFEFGNEDGGQPQARLQHPLGLAVAKGHILVADSYNGSIRSYDLETGEMSTLAATCTDAACRPWSEPAGIATDGAERLLLSDTNNHRIVEIRLDQGQARTWME